MGRLCICVDNLVNYLVSSIESGVSMNDLHMLIINLSFIAVGFIQVYKIFLLKDAKSHSYIWHVITFFGLFWLSIEYLNSPFFMSFVSCLLNALVRLVIVAQMLWYNRKGGE